MPSSKRENTLAYPMILVLGATGKTGFAVATQLLQRGVPVRGIVRREDTRSAGLRRLGMEIVQADLFDADQMTAAMRGVQRAYYLPPFHQRMVQSAETFVAAAKATRLESFVGVTQWLSSPTHPSVLTRQHAAVDRLFGQLTDIGFTTVQPGLFADTYLRVIQYAALLGIFPMPVDGASRNAPPSNEDIARVSVAALLDPATHAGKAYRPTGPTLLSVDEMMEIMGRVFGRKVKHVKLPPWMLLKAARMDGTSESELDGLPFYLEDHSMGAFERGAPTDDVFNLAGQQPESFETIVRRYAQQSQVQPTLRNKTRLFARFLAVPLMPGFNHSRYQKASVGPLPNAFELAMQSEAWRAGHPARTSDWTPTPGRVGAAA